MPLLPLALLTQRVPNAFAVLAMAVQARHFPHNSLAPAAGASLFLDAYAGRVPAPAPIGDARTVLNDDFPRSDLAWPCNHGRFLPRKRPRLEAADQAQAALAAGGDLFQDQRVGMRMPPACTERLLQPAVPPPFVDVQVQGRAVGSGAASTSGRMGNGATPPAVVSLELLPSWTHRHGVEIDALVRLEAERMRAALKEARRRHARALLAAVARAASGSGRLRASEADLERALRRNAELEEKARQAGAECQAWVGVARSHEAVAAGLRATLDQVLLRSSPCGAGARAPAAGGGCQAEDAQLCCFEAHATEDDDADDGACACASSTSRSKSLACKSCGGGEACVLLLPCRHLCLCRVCEDAVDACPVCANTKNGSLHVLFS